MKALTLFLLLPLQLFAQDITGIWTGTVITSQKQIPYEVAISRNGDNLTAYTYITFNVNGIEFYALKSAAVKFEDGNVTIDEQDMLNNNLREGQPKRIRQLDEMILKKDNDSWQ